MNGVLSVLDYLFAGSQNTPMLSIKHLKHLNLFSFNVMGIKIYRFFHKFIKQVIVGSIWQYRS